MDYRNSLGILVKGGFYADVGDVCVPSGRLLFPYFLATFWVCQEAVCAQPRVLACGPAHLVGAGGRARARRLEGMNHPPGFGVPSGGGILQLRLFSRPRFSYSSCRFGICLELRVFFFSSPLVLARVAPT